MVLLIKEGSILFPSFDQDYIYKVIDTLKLETMGWNQVYNSSPNKYDSFLLQTKPMESKKRREKKPSPQVPEYVSKTARLQALGKHQRQESSGNSSTASLSPAMLYMYCTILCNHEYIMYHTRYLDYMSPHVALAP